MTFKSIHNRFLVMPMTKYMLLAIFWVFILNVLSFEPIDPTIIGKYSLDALTSNRLLKSLLTIPIMLLNLYLTIKLMVALPLWIFSLPFKNRVSLEMTAFFQLLGCVLSVILILIIFTETNLYALLFQILFALLIFYTYLLFKQRKDFSPFWATLIVLYFPTIIFVISYLQNDLFK